MRSPLLFGQSPDAGRRIAAERPRGEDARARVRRPRLAERRRRVVRQVPRAGARGDAALRGGATLVVRESAPQSGRRRRRARAPARRRAPRAPRGLCGARRRARHGQGLPHRARGAAVVEPAAARGRGHPRAASRAGFGRRGAGLVFVFRKVGRARGRDPHRGRGKGPRAAARHSRVRRGAPRRSKAVPARQIRSVLLDRQTRAHRHCRPARIYGGDEAGDPRPARRRRAFDAPRLAGGQERRRRDVRHARVGAAPGARLRPRKRRRRGPRKRRGRLCRRGAP
mmetsp:Transcript_13308/g.44479  ORF Transcript_13308/g.44479 Transcript_13308/m.44479 type:complete len:283 (-) Transcript_13308:227-1075(-)